MNGQLESMHARDTTTLSAVPNTELLDNTANKDKGQLATTSALVTRRPPTRKNSTGVSLFSCIILHVHLHVVAFPL